MIARMSDRLIRYRVLDAVPAEGRVERGFHRVGVVTAVLFGPAVSWVLGALGEQGTPELIGLAVAVVAGLIIYGAVRAIGWAASGFFGQ